MSQPGRMRIAVEIDVITRESGSVEATLTGYRVLSGEIEASTEAANKGTRAFTGQTYALRRVAFDLRMMGIGLRNLRSELGGINPLLDATTSALIAVGGGATAFVGAYSLYRSVMRLLPEEARSVGGALGFLKNSFIGAAGGSALLGYALGGLIAVGVGVAMFEWKSGIIGVRNEISALKRDLEDLNSTMRDIQLAQAGVSAESAYYQYRISLLKREIDLQGGATRAQTEELEALEAGLRGTATASAFLSWRSADQAHSQLQVNDAIKDGEEAIKDYYRATGEALAGLATTPGTYSPILGVTAPGGAGLGAEMTPGGMRNGYGGMSVTVPISFPNAQFSREIDLVNAMNTAGQMAGDAAGLELMRRGVRSRP